MTLETLSFVFFVHSFFFFFEKNKTKHLFKIITSPREGQLLRALYLSCHTCFSDGFCLFVCDVLQSECCGSEQGAANSVGSVFCDVIGYLTKDYFQAGKESLWEKEDSNYLTNFWFRAHFHFFCLSFSFKLMAPCSIYHGMKVVTHVLLSLSSNSIHWHLSTCSIDAVNTWNVCSQHHNWADPGRNS